MLRGVGVAVVGVALAATTASGAAAVKVPVVRCHTIFGVGGPPKHVPATLRVTPSERLGKLVAYTNTEIFLLGPRGLHCAGLVAADGGSQIVAWPPGVPKPGPHAHTDGLTLTLDTACAGCKADDACPFLTALARRLGFPCTHGVPAGEITAEQRGDVFFEDPPGVSGSGWPSGGRDAAVGVVGTRGSATSGVVFRSTCTLPEDQRGFCTDAFGDELARYG